MIKIRHVVARWLLESAPIYSFQTKIPMLDFGAVLVHWPFIIVHYDMDLLEWIYNFDLEITCDSGVTWTDDMIGLEN